MYGYIKDIEDVAGQVLSLEAPAELSLANMVLDNSMQDILRSGVAQAPPQLILLVADNALEMILANSKPPLLLPTNSYKGETCRRVRIDSDDGSLVLWIDERTFALHGSISRPPRSRRIWSRMAR